MLLGRYFCMQIFKKRLKLKKKEKEHEQAKRQSSIQKGERQKG